MDTRRTLARCLITGIAAATVIVFVYSLPEMFEDSPRTQTAQR